MKISYPAFTAMAFMIFSAEAEVFKCQSRTGKTIYQSEPCASTSQHQRILNVEQMTPEQRELAKAKLRNWQDQQATADAAKAEAEKDRQRERQRQEELALQRRSVIAQEQQARAAAQQQNQFRQGLGYSPYYPYYQPWSGEQIYPHSPYDNSYRHRHFETSPPSQLNPPNSTQMNPPNRPYTNPPAAPELNPPNIQRWPERFNH